MIELPEVLGSEPVYKGRLFDVGHARLRFSDGVETERAIVQHQGAFAADRGEHAARFQGRGAHGIQDQRAADHQHQKSQNKISAFGIGGEGMDRCQNARPHDKGAQQAE